MFVTSSGSAYARFQRAMHTGNLTLIRAAAAELPRIDLVDALAIVETVGRQTPRAFDRAALRWLARYSVEHARTPQDVAFAAAAFGRMREDPVGARKALLALVAG